MRTRASTSSRLTAPEPKRAASSSARVPAASARLPRAGARATAARPAEAESPVAADDPEAPCRPAPGGESPSAGAAGASDLVVVEARLQVVGWREWLGLPELGIPTIKAKIDTGARTSALHSAWVEPFERDGARMVRFQVHPAQGCEDDALLCEAPVVDHRLVTSSSGQREWRYVIRTRVHLGGVAWENEVTLTNRDTMTFRMLLGRTAIRGRFLVDPTRSFLIGGAQPAKPAAGGPVGS